MKKCDICGKNCTTYVDGATRSGPWANMCLSCFNVHGIGLGTGRGQKYEVHAGVWRKVAG